MPPQSVSDRLVRDLVAEIGQRAGERGSAQRNQSDSKYGTADRLNVSDSIQGQEFDWIAEPGIAWAKPSGVLGLNKSTSSSSDL
jgi:hypothetical protein